MQTTTSNKELNRWSCPNFVMASCKPASISKISTIASIAHRFVNLIHGHKKELLTGLRLFAVLSIPNIISGTVNAIKGVFQSPTLSASWLRLTSQLGSSISAVCGVAQSLKSNNLVSPGSVNWTSPLSVVGQILSLANIVLNIQNIYQTKKVLKAMHKEVNSQASDQLSLEDYNKKMNALFANRPIQFTAHLLNTKMDVKKRLQDIQQVAQKAMESGLVEEQVKARKKLHDTFALIEGRFTSNIHSGYINIISSLVSTVASKLLVTPLMPLGSGLLLAISVGNFARSHFSEKATEQFNAALSN